MQLMSTNLTTLGLRYTLIFDAGEKRIKHGVLGMFLEQTSQLICGISAPEIPASYLPFSEQENRFEAVYMSITYNSVTYRAINKEGGYNLEVTFTSPFLPQQEKMNVAPMFYVDVKVQRSTRPHNLVKVKQNISEGTLLFGLQADDLQLYPRGHRCGISYDIQTSSRFVLGDFARTLNLKLYQNGQALETVNCQELLYSFDGRANEKGVFEVPFQLSEQVPEFKTSFVLAGYSQVRDFISIHEKPYNLLYTSYFQDIEAVLQYAIENKEACMQQSAFMDQSITDTSLSQSWKDFIAFTFQSYKLNTVYCCDKEGNKAYHVWEGNCMYNSTMDVEYNNGLFYYTYFPEVLPVLLDQWAQTEQGEGYIDHDCGAGYVIEKANYSYPMIIEENCNFIQMLYAYCVQQGSWEKAKQHYETLKKLVKCIFEADTTGNGIPNTGTDNTIDDAVPAIQNAKEQTYLAIKSACTLQCFAKIAVAQSDLSNANAATQRANKIIDSVEEVLWKGDHYAVCTDETQDGYWRFLTHETLSGAMEGKDSYSIYAENGMLYPMMSGFMPERLNYNRLSENIFCSEKYCSTEYGCNHSNDSDSIWFSQNLWRDFIAAYLGHDMLDNVDKYWGFQKIMNTNKRLNLYIDTFGENALWYYPRGLTSVGVLYAMLRLQIDAFQKEIRISPLRKSLRIPLVSFADWNARILPWVVVKDGIVQIEHEELLKGYRVVILES